METVISPKPKMGRPSGISPENFKHQIMKNALESSRSLNVRALCKQIRISHEHFYYIINGRGPVSGKILQRVIVAMGFSPEEIISEKTLSQMSDNT